MKIINLPIKKSLIEKSPFDPCPIISSHEKSLLDKALAASKKAYCPYSHFSVGACVETETGDIFEGCNVENASYGLSNCAERTAIFSAVSHGMKKIKTIAVIADTKGPVSPCGACRQVISEFADESTTIILANTRGDVAVMSVKDLLPYGFSF
ncbi:Cytidine deaminase, homotetrameric like protein [Aduncisulcus paluster]|uniref:Cytidine deaminase n=1 Tax=Aduncisulcus paluster TaxID=2918883 RepID=A0ABQ5K4J1_9EUKA|nr:Cytidine deaminase, homotetrameric like protein [Aduncisulcus paluster]